MLREVFTIGGITSEPFISLRLCRCPQRTKLRLCCADQLTVLWSGLPDSLQVLPHASSQTPQRSAWRAQWSTQNTFRYPRQHKRADPQASAKTSFRIQASGATSGLIGSVIIQFSLWALPLERWVRLAGWQSNKLMASEIADRRTVQLIARAGGGRRPGY